MSKVIFVFITSMMCMQLTYAQAKLPNIVDANATKEEKEILDLSKNKWICFDDNKVYSINDIINDRNYCLFYRYHQKFH